MKNKNQQAFQDLNLVYLNPENASITFSALSPSFALFVRVIDDALSSRAKACPSLFDVVPAFARSNRQRILINKIKIK